LEEVDRRNEGKSKTKPINNCRELAVSQDIDLVDKSQLDSTGTITARQKETRTNKKVEMDITRTDADIEEVENNDYAAEIDLPDLSTPETQNKKRKFDQFETDVSKTKTMRMRQSPTKEQNQIHVQLESMTRHSSNEVNDTLRSTGTGTVVIIKPLSNNLNELMNNPIEIASIIKESIFGTVNLKDVRTNTKKGLIIAELQQPNAEIMRKLIDITHLGSWQVKCYLPNSELFKVGVISPVSLNTDMDKIKELIQIKESDIIIEKIERLKRKTENGWQPSASLKIVFRGSKLPEAVTIAYSYYRVRPYVGEPLQCYRCQRLGHTATGCRAQVRCLVCGNNHPKEICQSNYIKCANCSQDHMANSKNCPRMKMAYEIEKVRADTNETYMNARQIVIDKNKENYNVNTVNNIQTHTVEAEIHQAAENGSSTRQTYSDILQYRRPNQTETRPSTSLNQKSNKENKTFISCETQTEPIHQREYDINMNHYENNFLNKFKNCLLELFQSNILRENTQTQALLVESAIRHNFKDQPTKDQSNNLTQNPNIVDQLDSTATQRNKKIRNAETKDTEETSIDEDAVISHSSDSEEQSIWKTIEKKSIKVPNNKRTTRNASNNQDENFGNGIKKQKGQKRKNKK
jgi:hypothetical protein